MNILYANAGSEAHRLQAIIIICGSDICVCLCGGTHNHVGACALGIPRNSLRDDKKQSASVSVLTATGHKEDELVRKAAHRIAASFNCRVSVSAGVHIDNATPDDIKLLWDNFEELLDEVEGQIKNVQSRT